MMRRLALRSRRTALAFTLTMAAGILAAISAGSVSLAQETPPQEDGDEGDEPPPPRPGAPPRPGGRPGSPPPPRPRTPAPAPDAPPPDAPPPDAPPPDAPAPDAPPPDAPAPDAPPPDAPKPDEAKPDEPPAPRPGGPPRPGRPGGPPRPGGPRPGQPAPPPPQPDPAPTPDPQPAGSDEPGEPNPAEPKPAEPKPAEPKPAPPPPKPEGEPEPPPVEEPTEIEGEGPLGGAGGRAALGESLWPKDFVPIPDRWRLDFPRWPGRGAEAPSDVPYEEGSLLNPYRQNILKGDYPVFGQEWFFVLLLASDTLVEGRSFPIPSGVSTRQDNSEDFFGQFDQLLFNQNFIVSAELFKGDTAFRPKDLTFKVTAVMNGSYLQVFENNLVGIDVREADDRLDGHIGLQEALFDIHLFDLSSNYDFTTLIVGIQPFQSDFRGFLFTDNNMAVRLQTNYASNRIQLNLAYFEQLEKDTNSGLNKYVFRNQSVFIANLFIQDFMSEISEAFFGYTFLLNYHFNLDDSKRRFDENEFLVRPAKIGFAADEFGQFKPKDVKVHYIGVGGEGHIGRLNIMHQYYCAIGEESRNEITGRRQDVLAHFGALELSVDIDWVRLKASALYQSGDRDPDNSRAAGFDAIFENPFFAGAGFSYFNRQNIPLVQSGVQLKQRLGLLNDLRSSKIEGQANFVNPGLRLLNAGVSARLSPKLFVDLNANWLWFDSTEVLQRVLVQENIDEFIGTDLSVGIQYRPFLTENVIFTASAATLIPGTGFKQIYRDRTLYSGFLALTLTF